MSFKTLLTSMILVFTFMFAFSSESLAKGPGKKSHGAQDHKKKKVVAKAEKKQKRDVASYKKGKKQKRDLAGKKKKNKKSKKSKKKSHY